MAYINRHSKDYFTWSASQSATYWMRNEEERELDRRWKTAWYSCETRFRDACLESNSRARYTCKLKSCIYIYIYVYSKRNWRKKKEKKKNKPEQNLQNHLNGIDSSNHVTRVFLAYKKKKKIDVWLISLLAGLQRHAYRWIDVSPANKRGQFRIHQYPCELKRFGRWKGYPRAEKIMNGFR